MGKTVSASAISEYLSDERASKKKKTIKLSAPEYKYNDDIESGALDIAKGVGQAASLVMLPSGIASITRGVGKVTGKRNETAEKVTSALAMPSAKMWQGFMGGAEGIFDFVIGGGAQLAGAVSKNKDIKDAAKWIYSNSWSSELSGAKDVDETLKNDSTAYRVTGDVLSGIGNVAFQMGLAMLTMGAANAATAAGSAGALAGNSGMSVGLAKGITYGSLFASAAGSGTAESMSKTGDLGWRENLSGVLKGGVEVATELISPTGQLIGTKYLENAAAKGSVEAAKKLAARTMNDSIKISTKRALAKKLVSNFAGEAAEEMLSYAGGWLIENKLDISDENFSVQEMLYQGLMGGIAGSIFSSPADVHMFRVNKSTGAAVYAKGDAYAQGKINEGLTLVKLYKEKGVKGGAIDLAEAALTKLATDETLSQTQKEYYMGLAENVVLKTDLSETAKQYATDLAERAAADPSYAESVANSLNAIVNEAGGKGEYTAADIANKDSGAARIVTLSQMLNDWLSRSDAEIATDEIMRRKAALYQGTAEQKTAIRSMEDGSTVAFRVGANAYAVVTKRAGTDTYSVGFTTPGQVERDGAVYATHNLSADKVEELLSKPMTEQQIDAGIVNRAEASGQAQGRAEKPKPKRKPNPTTATETAKPEAKPEAKPTETAEQKPEQKPQPKRKPKPEPKRKPESRQTSTETPETRETAQTEQTAQTDRAEIETRTEARPTAEQTTETSAEKKANAEIERVGKDGFEGINAYDKFIRKGRKSGLFHTVDDATGNPVIAYGILVPDSALDALQNMGEDTDTGSDKAFGTIDGADYAIEIGLTVDEVLKNAPKTKTGYTGYTVINGVAYENSAIANVSACLANPRLAINGQNLIIKGDNTTGFVYATKNADVQDGAFEYTDAAVEARNEAYRQESERQGHEHSRKLYDEGDKSGVSVDELRAALNKSTDGFVRINGVAYNAKNLLKAIDKIGAESIAQNGYTLALKGKNGYETVSATTEWQTRGKATVFEHNDPDGTSFSPTSAESAEQTEKPKRKPSAKKTTAKQATIEDLSTVEKRLTSAFGIDGSEFTKEEWAKARECVPNIDGLTRREQARVLTLVRTAQANGINEDYMKGLARLSSVYGFGVVFEDIDVAGFYSRKNGMVVINPNNLDETFGHEIEHSFDQIVKEGKAEFRTDLSEKVKRIVGASVFDRAKAQYKADYEKLRARDGSVAEMSDAELEAEATANVVGKYLSNMTLLKKIAATDYSLGRGLLAAIRRMKDKWTSAKAFAKENDSTTFAEYRKMTRIERMLMDELNKRKIPVYPIGDFDVSYSVSEWERMKENHAKYLSKKGIKVDLDVAHTMIDTVVEEMRKYAEILPQDRIGKTLVGNASYGLSVENTTICPRTLSYNEFTDKVQAKIGRPMTQMESFLASQMLYEIATDPQCLYCYVALDRKAYNEYLLRYFERRDAVIKEYREMTDKSDEAVFGKIKRDKNGNPVIGKRGHQLREGGLYAKFLGDSIDTENMEIRFRNWIGLADSGETLLTPEDVATEERKARLKNDPTSALGEQFADAHAYAQGASQAKVQHDYVAYFDDILKLSDRTVRKLNKHYGLRWYSFSDYSGAFIAENMQQVTDAAIRGLKGLAYTKDTDFAAIFAPTGMGINVSVFVTKDENGNFVVDEKQSAKLDEAIKLRNKYKNVGIVVTAATDDAVVWAMQQEWSDVVIPFHIVRTGQEVAEFYKWMNYTHESGDTVRDQELWDSYQRMVGSKRASKLIYPSEHNNDYETYMRLCAERGLKPRFERFSKMDGITPEQYMKLVNETRLPASDTTPLKAEFDLEAAKASFQKFVDKGGYWGSWYKDDADVEASAERVAQDVSAGKKANEVEYGRQDKFNPEAIMRARKKVRQHGTGVSPNTSYSPAPVAPSVSPAWDTSSAAFKRWFGNSPFKNEDGTPKVYYHGAKKGGGFTVFRDWQYFTDKKQYAERYAERDNPNALYEVYLTADKVFDTRNADARKIFQSIRDEYGLSELQDTGLPDWTDGYDITEYLSEHPELGYDAVILDEGGDLVDGEPVSRGESIIIKDSAQVKSATDNIGTYDRATPDIRYSPASTNGSGRIVIQASQSRPTGREKLTNLKGELSRSNFRAALESLQVIAVNAQQGVENQLVRAGMTKREAAAFSQLARSGRSHAINAICYKLADMTGAIRSEGLIPIIEPFLATKGEVYDAVDKDGNTVQSTAKGGELAGNRYSEFSDYYAMLHAIDREAVGKNPYSSMTVAQMKQIVAEYEQKNPDFKAAAEKLSAFNSAMLDIEVQAGIISQETADLWRKQYPHYVPMYTQDSNAVGGKPVRGSRNMEVRRDNAAATESDHRVSDPLRNYIDQVQRRIRAAKLNILLNEVYNSADGVNVVTAEADRAEAKDLREREQAYLENPESENDPAEMFRKFKRGKNTVNEVSFYKDGKRVTMAVTDRIYTGLSDLGGIHSSILDSWTVKAVKKVNDTFKKLVTNWNPFFAVKNIARDLQDGTLQSRFGMGEFLNMYRKNAEMMATGKYNDMWEEFLANGGLESSLYSDEFGTFTKGGKSGLEQATGIVGQFQHIKNFNTLTEALPRFTEFCLTLKHGGTIQQAIYNAADVTVNFGRSGTLIRILNSTVSPFLNPAVQGLDRVIRLFTEDGIKNNKALASLLLKAVLLAIVPMALGNAMYGDDDEYKDMKDSIKENNYLFKVGDTWLKLPRGRVVSTISGLFNRSYKQLSGQDVDWGDYGKNVLDQITPAQNVARHIGSPFMDVANNRTWYGTKIESDALQNYAVNQRYDENTSRISVWIGQLTSHFGLSPKEVNYLIDQYTGVIGDILLPTTTPAGTKGVVSYNFTVDPNTSSNLSNRFYDLYNKTMYKTNDGDVEAYYLKKRLDETKSAVSELFKQIKTINASSELSNKEKVKQASAIRASINQLYKTALDDRRLYEQNIKDALAIENSYAVEKITAQSAKRYGLDSDAVGKYALTFGGDFAKQFNTEAQANDYKADAAKKTVYAEANRLTYGAEYALREYNSNVYEKAKTLNELGIDWEDYYSYYMTARYYSGKTKKQKILAYLNGSGLSKSQIALMMYYSGYSAYADEAKKAIRASSLSAERKKELLAGITD